MTESADNILTAQGLHKSYGRGPAAVHVLRGLDITVRRGEFVAIMGPSGCGKTTLLHVLGMMTTPDTLTRPSGPPSPIKGEGKRAGRIVLDGEEVAFSPGQMNRLRRDKIGFVFQRFNLISVLSAADNVAISLRVRGRTYDSSVDELFAALGVSHVKGRKPGAMSIGEQQRVAVVRALAHRPAILLADEPTGNLDSDNSAALLKTFREMNAQRRQTLVMITHSAEAAAFADRTVRMKDGRIVET